MGLMFSKEQLYKKVERVLLREDMTVQVIDRELRELIATYLDPSYHQIRNMDLHIVLNYMILFLLTIQSRERRESIPILGKIVWDLSKKIPDDRMIYSIERYRNANVLMTYNNVMKWMTASDMAPACLDIIFKSIDDDDEMAAAE
jgi:hypothetical protein